MSAGNHLVFPNIDPVIFEIGPVALRWYGLMYLLGFAAAYWLANRRIARMGWTKEQLSDLLFWCFMGVILGGRIGYVFFYQFEQLGDDPLYLFRIWEGGMSFHGGCLGVIVAAYLFAKKQKWSFLQVGDFIAPLVPVGLGAGRIGNFINGELWGRTTDVSWAFVFPTGGPEPRHPSQLYEFFLEGAVLFVILWLYSAKPRPVGTVGGGFLLGYGVFRFIVEFYREPDSHLGLYSFGLSQGQMLCIPMILAGLGLIVYAVKSKQKGA
ncbi:prolipoprotein diacylglyceryl transferase [Agaribacter marinus]|uniref:Phosphatidylglycerol--prolipoprotein diacylglyceryl transferase n=1 Tax=Agaribacter marinus TaxID=1431249 RepID=A0AA37SYI3_9ALTE|nr:prolipoprotein diacylglyceryl transferase [Agaribacter marinus]GLR72387.1 prolipoprotein diacylglyceryl transferase [Agaribacter marinus]